MLLSCRRLRISRTAFVNVLKHRLRFRFVERLVVGTGQASIQCVLDHVVHSGASLLRAPPHRSEQFAHLLQQLPRDLLDFLPLGIAQFGRGTRQDVGDGCIAQPRGCVVQPRGCAVQPCGRVVQPCGCVTQPCGCVTQPWGCIGQPRGCAVQSRGRVVAERPWGARNASRTVKWCSWPPPGHRSRSRRCETKPTQVPRGSWQGGLPRQQPRQQEAACPAEVLDLALKREDAPALSSTLLPAVKRTMPQGREARRRQSWASGRYRIKPGDNNPQA